MKLIYFHGFGSSAQSGTIRTLRKMLSDFEVIAPDIPVDPADALPFLKQLCEDEQPDVVIGTSMGGMYAQQMFGFNRICVNPAFEMSTMSKVLKVGTFEYFNPRMDGETHFTITPDIIKHHADILEKPLACLSLNAVLALIHGLSEVLVVAPFFFSGYMFTPAQLTSGFIMSVVVLVGFGTVVHSFVDCSISVLLWKCVKSTVPSIKLIRG